MKTFDDKRMNQPSLPLKLTYHNRISVCCYSSPQIWPRGIVGAGPFWNYQSELDSESAEFKLRYQQQQRVKYLHQIYVLFVMIYMVLFGLSPVFQFLSQERDKDVKLL